MQEPKKNDITLFLTSNPFVPGECVITPLNGFRDELMREVGDLARCVFVTSSRLDRRSTDEAAYSIKFALQRAGMGFVSFSILDGRTAVLAEELISKANFVILMGGHVPTQWEFFEEINLRRLLKEKFTGVVMGISAGSMNSAVTVYRWPEMPGESIDPDYELFAPGLGLTRTNILPHYWAEKDKWLDGKNMVDEIAVPHSIGHRFVALPDGSYIIQKNFKEFIKGEAYEVKDGNVTPLSKEGEIIRWN